MLRSLVRHAHFGGGSPSQAPFRKAAEKVTIGAGSSSGRIALRNAVEKSMISRSLSETAPRVLSLHRDLLRSVPWVKRAYAVIMPESVRRPHPPSMFNRIPCAWRCPPKSHPPERPPGAGDAHAHYQGVPRQEGHDGRGAGEQDGRLRSHGARGDLDAVRGLGLGLGLGLGVGLGVRVRARHRITQVEG